MTNINQKRTRVLGIAPSTRGFGFGVMEGSGTLVDWGVKGVTNDKNKECLARLSELISHYDPKRIILEHPQKGCSRSPRIVTLNRKIVAMAKRRAVPATLMCRPDIRQLFFGKNKGTKHAVAELLASRFPEELSPRLPPKRRPWMSEDYRMSIFDAVALCVAFQERGQNQSKTSQ